MKYFTKDWGGADQSEEETDRIRDSYWARIKILAPGLPPGVLELATATNLHDGLIRRVALDRSGRSLVASLRCGDLQVGYFDVDLVYQDVDLAVLDSAALRAAVTDPETEVLWDEVDLEPSGQFIHRILFSPTREVDLAFRSVTVNRSPKPNRELGDRAGQYQES